MISHGYLKVWKRDWRRRVEKRKSGRVSLCEQCALISVGRNAICESVWCLNRDSHWRVRARTRQKTHAYAQRRVRALSRRETGGMEKKRGFKRHWQALTLFLGQWQEAYSTERHADTQVKSTQILAVYHSRMSNSNICIHARTSCAYTQIYLAAFTVNPKRPWQY